MAERERERFGIFYRVECDSCQLMLMLTSAAIIVFYQVRISCALFVASRKNTYKSKHTWKCIVHVDTFLADDQAKHINLLFS